MRKSIFVKKWRNISTGLLSIIFLLNFFSGSNQWLASVTCFFFSYKSSLISSPLRVRQAVQLWWPSPLHKVTYFSETCYSLHLFWAPVVTRSDLSRFGWSCPLRDVACARMSWGVFCILEPKFCIPELVPPPTPRPPFTYPSHNSSRIIIPYSPRKTDEVSPEAIASYSWNGV